MNSTAWIWAIVAVIIIGGGAWWYLSGSSAQPTTEQQQTTATTTSTGTDQGMPDTGVTGGVSAGVSVTTGSPKTVTVTYNGSSFSPASVSISKGDTVKFVDTAGQMWLASDPHPSHTAYDGTSRSTHCAAGYSGPAPLDECGTGSSFSFTFNKTGTFGYHDHLVDENHGTVIVQ